MAGLVVYYHLTYLRTTLIVINGTLTWIFLIFWQNHQSPFNELIENGEPLFWRRTQVPGVIYQKEKNIHVNYAVFTNILDEDID